MNQAMIPGISLIKLVHKKPKPRDSRRPDYQLFRNKSVEVVGAPKDCTTELECFSLVIKLEYFPLVDQAGDVQQVLLGKVDHLDRALGPH